MGLELEAAAAMAKVCEGLLWLSLPLLLAARQEDDSEDGSLLSPVQLDGMTTGGGGVPSALDSAATNNSHLEDMPIALHTDVFSPTSVFKPPVIAEAWDCSFSDCSKAKAACASACQIAPGDCDCDEKPDASNTSLGSGQFCWRPKEVIKCQGMQFGHAQGNNMQPNRDWAKHGKKPGERGDISMHPSGGSADTSPGCVEPSICTQIGCGQAADYQVE